MKNWSALLLLGTLTLPACSSERLCDGAAGTLRSAGCEDVRTRSGQGGTSSQLDCVEIQADSHWESLSTPAPNYEIYVAVVTPNLGEANPEFLTLVMWDNDVGSFDFSEGFDANHETCQHCLFLETDLVREDDTLFLATSGHLEIAPPSEAVNGRLNAVVSDVQFDEVTIDIESTRSTPVRGGPCFHLETASIRVPPS